MRRFTITALGALCITCALGAAEPVQLTAKTEPVKRHCQCMNCQCTPEQHCGCFSDEGCHCTGSSPCKMGRSAPQALVQAN